MLELPRVYSLFSLVLLSATGREQGVSSWCLCSRRAVRVSTARQQQSVALTYSMVLKRSTKPDSKVRQVPWLSEAWSVYTQSAFLNLHQTT